MSLSLRIKQVIVLIMSYVAMLQVFANTDCIAKANNIQVDILISSDDNEISNKKALFREIYTNAYEKISAILEQQKYSKNTWGVIFAIDGTLIDEKTHLVTPGATEITCKIQSLGGYVFIVTGQRDKLSKHTDFITDTVLDLKKKGICFDSILFANDAKDNNKSTRFSAISTGDYENITTSRRLPATNIIAYFGSKIQDFPDLKQNLAIRLPITDKMFNAFGQKYFMLPQ